MHYVQAMRAKTSIPMQATKNQRHDHTIYIIKQKKQPNYIITGKLFLIEDRGQTDRVMVGESWVRVDLDL